MLFMEIGIFATEKLTPEKIEVIKRFRTTGIFIGIQNVDKTAIKLAKKVGLRLNVETGIFVGDQWWQKYPDSRPVDRHGKLMEKIGWYTGVCPNHPQVRHEQLNNIRRLVKNFDIEGIWLDFLRYPCHWETVRSADITEYCYCKNCLKTFARDGGEKPEGEQWT